MEKERFENILQKDEEIIWAEGVNKGAFKIKNCLKYVVKFALVGAFVAQIVTIVAGVATSDSPDSSAISVFKYWPITWLIVFVIGIFVGIILSTLEANNTYFAITNKRIIKRSGIFNISFIHYSLKNIGTVNVQGGIFDSRGENASASLFITVKDFHTNTDGNTRPMRLSIDSLNCAYKAYNLLSEEVDGNNENLRVKLEK